jgi:hypothetical protein
MHYRQDLEEKIILYNPIMWREHYANQNPPTYVCKNKKKRKNQFVYSVNEGLSQLIDLTSDQGIMR